MSSVALTKAVEHLKLENLTPDIDMSDIRINTPDINRRLCSSLWDISKTLNPSGCRLWGM